MQILRSTHLYIECMRYFIYTKMGRYFKAFSAMVTESLLLLLLPSQSRMAIANENQNCSKINGSECQWGGDGHFIFGMVHRVSVRSPAGGCVPIAWIENRCRPTMVWSHSAASTRIVSSSKDVCMAWDYRVPHIETIHQTVYATTSGKLMFHQQIYTHIMFG